MSSHCGSSYMSMSWGSSSASSGASGFSSSIESLSMDETTNFSFLLSKASSPHLSHFPEEIVKAPCPEPLAEPSWPLSTPGSLLRSLEKGVLYPMIHCSATPMKEAGTDDLVDPLLSKSSISNDSENLEMYQGVYRELKRVIPPDAWIHSHEPSSPPAKTWLFIGYKSLEKTLDPTLLTTWKEWTGARHIYLNLRHDFDIQRISFYSRVSPLDNIDLFMYLVIMEIGNVNERNVMWLLDFIQRIRVQRISGFLTLYSQVEPQSQYSAKPNGSTSFLEKFFKSGDTKGEGEGSATSRKHFIEKLLQEINDTPILDLC